MPFRERVRVLREILSENGGNPAIAGQILRTAGGRDLTPMVVEHLAAAAARAEGHDAIIAYNDDRLTEIFDLRESHFPTPAGGFRLHRELRPRGGVTGASGRLLSATNRVPSSAPPPTVDPFSPEALTIARQIDREAAARALPLREVFHLDRAELTRDAAAAGLGAASNVGYGYAIEGERDPEDLAKRVLLGAAMGATGRHARQLAQDMAPVRVGAVAVPKEAVNPDPATRRSLRDLAGSVLGVPRQLLLMGDLGQLARIGVGGYLQSLSAGKGIQGAAAWGRAFRAAFDPGYFKELMARPEMQRWADVAYPADMSNPEMTSTFIQRLPGLGHAERAMFQRFTPALAAGVAETVFQGMKRHGDFAGMASDTERRAAIGDWVKGLLIGRELNDEQVGTVARAVGRLALAPRWTAGGIVGVQKILDPGPQGELARRFWATVALTGAAISVGLTTALTNKDPRNLINPTHPDSVLDPRNGRRFFGVELPNGVVISPFQPVLPLMRAVMRPFAEGYQSYQEERDIAAAVEAMVGEGWDAGRDYLLGKASIPVRLFNDLVIRGTDFQGRPIITKEGPAGWLQAAGYAAGQNAPIFTQPLLAPLTDRLNLPFDIERDARVPGTEPTLLDRALEFGAGFVGVTVRPPDRLPPDVAEALRGAIREKGQEPGADPDLVRQYYGLKLDPSEKARLFAEQPEVREFFEARTKLEGEKYEKPVGRARVREYQVKKARLDIDRRNAIAALEAENLTGNEYRRRRAAIMQRYRGMVQGLQEAIFDTADPDRIDAALDAVYRTAGEQSEERKALDGLYAIEQDGESREARNAYFAARQAYLDSLSPEMRQRLLQRQIDDAPTETEKSYIRAQQAYAEYAKIPRYRGITEEDAEAAIPYMQQAADLQRVRPGMSFRAALLRVGAPARERRTALKIRSGKYTNQARRRAFARDPLLARWYTELNAELAEQIAGAA
jgi:hypothetical protein